MSLYSNQGATSLNEADPFSGFTQQQHDTTKRIMTPSRNAEPHPLRTSGAIPDVQTTPSFDFPLLFPSGQDKATTCSFPPALKTITKTDDVNKKQQNPFNSNSPYLRAFSNLSSDASTHQEFDELSESDKRKAALLLQQHTLFKNKAAATSTSGQDHLNSANSANRQLLAQNQTTTFPKTAIYPSENSCQRYISKLSIPAFSSWKSWNWHITTLLAPNNLSFLLTWDVTSSPETPLCHSTLSSAEIISLQQLILTRIVPSIGLHQIDLVSTLDQSLPVLWSSLEMHYRVDPL